MKSSQSSFPLLTLTAAFFVASVVRAQVPPSPGATALCKDGTYTNTTTTSGACHGHQGVKQWLASTANATAATAPTVTSTPNADSGASPAAPDTATPVASSSSGEGSGMVWLNSGSNVYHCPGSHYYGKTKQGAYVSEAAAKAKGAHPDSNHPCAK